MSIRDCWYVRARPIFARLRAGRCVTSRPKSSTVPDDGGMSPEMTLKSVVLPAPFGPRIARRSPSATSSVTSDTACRPPKRRPTPRRRRVGSAFFFSGSAFNRLLDHRVRDLAVLDLPDLALPTAASSSTQGGKARLGAGLLGPNVPPNVWSTFGT